ncbi:MAG: transposase [Thermodesulfobacteriota bacterium]
MKRVVVPGYPHHIVQRGVRSMEIFFEEEDRLEYLTLLRKQGDRFGVKFLTYCLMTNHVHLLAVPSHPDSLARAIGEAHRLYTRMINFRENVRGYLFQGRFSSCPVSTDTYLLTAVQYILRNPVQAKMVKYPWDYQWSSAGYHCGLTSHDPLVQKSDLLSEVDDWKEFLNVDSEMSPVLEEKNRTGRPFGPDSFHAVVEKLTGCDTRPGTPGRPTKKQ